MKTQLTSALLIFACAAFADSRVLLIGVDGCRADALKKVVETGRAPHFKSLIESGTTTWSAFAGGELHTPTQQPTSSGPGWTTILTGAWLDRHGVRDNTFRLNRIADTPHIFRRIKDARPEMGTASLTDWPEIHQHIVERSKKDGASFLDFERTYAPDKTKPVYGYPANDITIASEAAAHLRDGNPGAMFVYFGQVDENGHGQNPGGKFSPDNELYLEAIAAVDAHLGTVLTALRARPKFSDENWLILATTDHGGTGTSHGKQSPEERTIWMIASGGAAPRGATITTPTPQTAIAPTVFRHLGLAPAAEWSAPFALPAEKK